MNSTKNKIRIILFIGVIALGFIGYTFFSDEAPLDGYQAVFLTNNQVYFGRLSQTNSKYVVLNDIYYIQLTQALQSQDQATSTSQGINLVKLGSELHSPEDEMRINRDHILFIEDLKPDSQVVTAIENYKRAQGE